MNCPEIQEMLSAYYDKELPLEKSDLVESHLRECSDCASEINGFVQLSSLAASLDSPKTPDAVWSNVEGVLQEEQKQVATSAEATSVWRAYVKYAVALAAMVLVGFVGFKLFFDGDHDHEEMVEAMEFVASHIEVPGAATHLLNKYGGGVVTPGDAYEQVGFHPIATKGLPAGYSVESIQVLDMPCCKCTQTACKRPDNSRFFIYEHENEDTGWFEHQNKRRTECCGKTCEIVELKNRLAVTWQKGNRHVTLLGVRDDDEIELLVSQFEKKS